MLARVQWTCRSCRASLKQVARQSSRSVGAPRSTITTTAARARPSESTPAKVRNIGIIAHIDAGKTTTTERMLYYSGFTRRIGNVDAGDTVTDFLPAERARGITIQSAAITFYWPPPPDQTAITSMLADKTRHTINLIDTPGHADFTFEVIRSLRILDGAICILDGVAGVEAQTEKVWAQARNYRIPLILYVNKLDRDGASFNRTVQDIASRLHTWPVLCQIPWFRNGQFVGVGDLINYKGLLWHEGSDGRQFDVLAVDSLQDSDPEFAQEMQTARTALIEALTEHDEIMVEQVLEAGDDYTAFPSDKILASLRRLLRHNQQAITPVFAGASFRNVGVQPLLDSINALLPAPHEAPDPTIKLGDITSTLGALRDPSKEQQQQQQQTLPAKKSAAAGTALQKLDACALAFKVVNDAKRGILVYIRVYSGAVRENALLYNTNLATSERVPRLLRMYASEAVEIDQIEQGQIGVLVGLKYARTGDTLVVYPGSTHKKPPPHPISSLQLRPIVVPPPLFYSSVEPNSLAEEKNLQATLGVLLREDPSLQVTTDAESGQTHLAGMGELHLEIARDRLLSDFKVKASMSKIEIGYRESLAAAAGPVAETSAREMGGKTTEASCVVSIRPREDSSVPPATDTSATVQLQDNNVLRISHPEMSARTGKALTEEPFPTEIPWKQIQGALVNGVLAALSRGPTHLFPVHSAMIDIAFEHATCLTPTSTPNAIAHATRQAVRKALAASAAAQATVMMEPVMLVTIAVDEASMGAVIHDLSSARGGTVLSLDAAADEAAADGAAASGSVAEAPTEQPSRLSAAQLARVYAPRDPFQSDLGAAGGGGSSSINQARQIRARVPLKEMVGYLKHLRSLTQGRGTFVMSVDQFERMTSQRQKAALDELRGDFGAF